VLNGYKHRGAYDFATGEPIWWMSGGGDIPIPVPQVDNDHIYFNSAHGKMAPLMAVKKSASGDITLEEGQTSSKYVSWLLPRGGSYMSSAMVYHDEIYTAKWNGNQRSGSYLHDHPSHYEGYDYFQDRGGFAGSWEVRQIANFQILNYLNE